MRFGDVAGRRLPEITPTQDPLLADLSKAIGRQPAVLSVTSYDALEQAIQRNEVDMAFLSGKMALDAVTLRQMVVAQVTRHDGLPGYRALLVRRAGRCASLDAVLSDPDAWRLARRSRARSRASSCRSCSSSCPTASPWNTLSQRRFVVGTHCQMTALAVANGEADVATNNTADFEQLQLQFPAEAAPAGDLGVGSHPRADRHAPRLPGRFPAARPGIPRGLCQGQGFQGRRRAVGTQVAATTWRVSCRRTTPR